MRIVFNLRDQDWQTTKSLGILHVSTRTIASLAELPGIDRIDVLANRSLASHLVPLEKNPCCRLHYLEAPAPRSWARLLWDHWTIVSECNRLAPDWLLLPKGFSPLLRWPTCRVSACVHDNVFDYYRRLGLRPFPRGQAILFSKMLQRTAARADSIVTVSAFTANEFTTAFQPRVNPVRIGAPVASTDHSHRSSRDSSTVSLLLPTSTWPHKLSLQALQWLKRWADETRFTGHVHGYGALPAGATWPGNDRWIHHGRVNDSTLLELENDSATLVYFSAYEGYGLPPVEAAAAGRRALASDIPALRETLPAASLFSNSDYASFARSLTQTLASPPVRPLAVDTATDVARRWLTALQSPPLSIRPPC